MTKPNIRQQKFAEQYAKHGNATQAAIDAGYSKKTARFQGSRLLTNVNVQDLVREHHRQRHMGPDEVLSGLADIARLDMEDFISPLKNGGARLNLPKAKRANKLGFIREITTKESQKVSEGDVVSEVIETKVKLYDKQRALETIANHHGLLKQPEININVNLHLHLELINRTWSALEKAGLDPVKTFEQLELLANGDIVH